jgi:DNA-binding MurR/RpiR family transcriptional regulator
MTALTEDPAPVPRDAAALLDRLHQARPALSPKLAAAADYLLARPDEIAFTSMRRMAERAGVQPAIMVRLAQRLGLDGYEALRTPFREVLHRRAESLGQRARDLQERVGRHGGGNPLARLAYERIARERENLDATLDGIGGERLAEVARGLAAMRRIFVGGAGGWFAAASQFHTAARLFRSDVMLLGGVGEEMGDGLRGIGAGDVLLLLAPLPLTDATARALAFVRDRGTAVVLVTDGTVPAAVAKGAAILPVVAETAGLLPSAVTAVALAQLLADQMAALGGQAALDAVAAAEVVRDALTVA